MESIRRGARRFTLPPKGLFTRGGSKRTVDLTLTAHVVHTELLRPSVCVCVTAVNQSSPRGVVIPWVTMATETLLSLAGVQPMALRDSPVPARWRGKSRAAGSPLPLSSRRRYV